MKRLIAILSTGLLLVSCASSPSYQTYVQPSGSGVVIQEVDDRVNTVSFMKQKK